MGEKLFLISAMLFLGFLGASIFYLSSEIGDSSITGYAVKEDFLVPEKIELINEFSACSIDGCDSSLRNIIDGDSRTFWASEEPEDILIDYEKIISEGEYKILYSWSGKENSSCVCSVFSSLDGSEFNQVLSESNNGTLVNKVVNLNKFRYIKISPDADCLGIQINNFKVESFI